MDYQLSALDEIPNPDMFTVGTNKGDDRLAIRFFKKAARDDVESEVQGRMVFKEAIYIQIMVPGDRDNIVIRPAGEGDKRRFAQHYQAFLQGDGKEQVIGLPLEAWGQLNLAQVEEYRYLGVRTVEQMAVLNDAACQRLPGSQELKRKAAAFIELTKEGEPMRKMEAALATRDNQIEAMAKQLEEQGTIIKQLQERDAAKQQSRK